MDVQYIRYQISHGEVAMLLVGCISSWILELAFIYTIANTYVLRKNGKLAPRGELQQDWFDLQEQDRVSAAETAVGSLA